MRFERLEEYIYCRDLKVLWRCLELTLRFQGFQMKVEPLSFLKNFYVCLLILETEEGREREREKHQCEREIWIYYLP